MSQDSPILILQMQRMGDLVLTFPLVGWLTAILPGRPIWIVGEKTFFNGLLSVSPQVTYFDYSDSAALKNRHYTLVLNLSHRPEAARLAAELRCDQLLGAYLDSAQRTIINGDWQLYRASLTCNNRHNLFHWADLNGLDITSTRILCRTVWPSVKVSAPEGRVGLFVGASEAHKRRAPEFWASLAAGLIARGYKPVLLGGHGDKAVADGAAALLGAPALNLCGKFNVHELCLFMNRLDLLITPDTGPMHLGVWLGVPTLNISIGPVNPWETGPFAPGHHIIQATVSCAGCWACSKPERFCRAALTPEDATLVAASILDGSNKHEHLRSLSGRTRIWKSARDKFGLHDLTHSGPDSQRLKRSRFWKLFFGKILGRFTTGEVKEELELCLPSMQDHGLQALLTRESEKLLLRLAPSIKKAGGADLHGDFWLDHPPLLRPLSSYVQFTLQNSLFSRQARLNALQYVEEFRAAIA